MKNDITKLKLECKCGKRATGLKQGVPTCRACWNVLEIMKGGLRDAKERVGSN